jgi:hypothetical protein
LNELTDGTVCSWTKRRLSMKATTILSLILGVALVIVASGTALAYDASGTWKGVVVSNRCGPLYPLPGNPCASAIIIDLVQDSGGDLTGAGVFCTDSSYSDRDINDDGIADGTLTALHLGAPPTGRRVVFSVTVTTGTAAFPGPCAPAVFTGVMRIDTTASSLDAVFSGINTDCLSETNRLTADKQ